MDTPLGRLRRMVAWSFLAALALLVLSWTAKGGLPEPEEIERSLRQAPRQAPTDRQPFDFGYKGKACRVRPVAEYELWGLVVSHNDISSVADIYHDATSVDTKDLCVVWGTGLGTGAYRRVEFSSGPFTCYVKWSEDATIDLASVGNNHLVTDSPELRRAIARVHVGDQIRLRGLLVDYQMDDWQGFWRRTSTVRTDTGCEVVFVEELELLRPGTPGWYRLWDLARLLVVLLPLTWAGIYLLQVRRGESVSLGRL